MRNQKIKILMKGKQFTQFRCSKLSKYQLVHAFSANKPIRLAKITTATKWWGIFRPTKKLNNSHLTLKRFVAARNWEFSFKITWNFIDCEFNLSVGESTVPQVRQPPFDFLNSNSSKDVGICQMAFQFVASAYNGANYRIFERSIRNSWKKFQGSSRDRKFVVYVFLWLLAQTRSPVSITSNFIPKLNESYLCLPHRFQISSALY